LFEHFASQIAAGALLKAPESFACILTCINRYLQIASTAGYHLVRNEHAAFAAIWLAIEPFFYMHIHILQDKSLHIFIPNQRA